MRKKAIFKKMVSLCIVVIMLVSTIAVNPMTVMSASTVPENARTISVNTFYTGNLAEYNETDYYKFTITQPSKASINFQHEIFDDSKIYWYIDILDTNGNKLVRLESKGNTSNLTSANVGVPAGTYYIRVSRDYHSDIDYSLKINCSTESNWEKENNNSFSAANPIVSNTLYYGSLSYYEDTDYYIINNSSSSKLSITFNHSVFDNTRTFWKIDLLDTNGNNLVRLESKGNTSSLTSANVGVPAGTYYIRVSRDYHSDMDYSLKINCSTESNWEKENNNSISAANPIVSNTLYYGSLAYYEDTDYYIINNSSSSKLSITFNHSVFDNTRTFWKIDLLDTNGNNLVRLESKGNTSSLTSANVGVPAGTYYIRVSRDYHSDIDYSLKINCSTESNWEKENNNSISAANPIVSNRLYYGSLAYYEDTDYYIINNSSSSKLSITFSHSVFDNTRTFWKIDLLDTNGNNLVRLESKGNTPSLTSANVEVPSGTYYIRVSRDYHSDIDYSFKVEPVSNTIIPTNPTTEPYKKQILGDVNGDEKINIKDATMIQKSAASLVTLTDEQAKAADVNKDGKVNVNDATAIQKFVAGIDTGLDIGK